MSTPVLVHSYRTTGPSSLHPHSHPPHDPTSQTLPPISSYTFASILRSSSTPEFQQAIDGIAEICAKNRMSLADEYGSHLPPLGEITATSSGAATAVGRVQALRPGGMRRALTSVPEASSGSSEGSGSRKSGGRKKVGGLFSFTRRRGGEELWQGQGQSQGVRRVRIGSMGRAVEVTGTTAMASNLAYPQELEGGRTDATNITQTSANPLVERRPSEAVSSLERLLNRTRNAEVAAGG